MVDGNNHLVMCHLGASKNFMLTQEVPHGKYSPVNQPIMTVFPFWSISNRFLGSCWFCTLNFVIWILRGGLHKFTSHYILLCFSIVMYRSEKLLERKVFFWSLQKSFYWIRVDSTSQYLYSFWQPEVLVHWVFLISSSTENSLHRIMVLMYEY